MKNDIGPTGQFPFGKLREDDKGELKVAIKTDQEKKIIFMYFNTPTTWLGLDQKGALNLVQILQEQIKKLEKELK
jgi:hypothetical protein